MGTEFTVINTETSDQWEALKYDEYSKNVTITDDGIELARAETPMYVAPEAVGRNSLESITPIDFDVDRCGARYVLAADGALYRAEASEESFTRLACDDLTARGAKPEAFCVAGDVIYVVGTQPDSEGADGRRGYVQTLSARLRQTRWIVDQIDDISFGNPIRVVRGRSTSGVYVVDCGRTDSDGGFVARVNDDGTARIVASDLQKPRDITVDDRGVLAVLDAARKDIDAGEKDTWVLRRYPATTNTPIPDRNEGGVEIDGSKAVDREEAGDGDQPPELPFDDAACIEAVGGDAFVVGVGPEAPNERTLYRYTATDGSFERLTSYKRSCIQLRRASCGGANPLLYAIDGDSQSRAAWVLEPATAVKRWERKEEGECATEATDPREGKYAGRFTTRFDLGSIGARQCRVHLDFGDVPPGTRVVCHYATTDRDLPGADCDCSRGFECNCGCNDGCPSEWRTVGTSTPSDVLVPLKRRRFLWLRLDLFGGQFTSPTIGSLKLSVTHESYIQYLPTIYQEDETSATFLAQFLSVFEDAFGDIDHAIMTLTRYFDPESVPEPHLSWLGSWLAVAEDEAWSERSKRKLIEEAPNLFKRRGTRQGLLRLLEIYLDGEERASVPWATVRDMDDMADVDSQHADEVGDHYVSLLEYGDVVAETDGTSAIGAEMDSLAPFRELVCCPQEFVVLLGPTVGEDAHGTIERIVASERPAHTLGRTVPLRMGGRLGDHVYLGVNSYLPPRELVVDESRLGLDSVVDKRRMGSQLGDLSRLGAGLELT